RAAPILRTFPHGGFARRSGQLPGGAGGEIERLLGSLGGGAYGLCDDFAGIGASALFSTVPVDQGSASRAGNSRGGGRLVGHGNFDGDRTGRDRLGRGAGLDLGAANG